MNYNLYKNNITYIFTIAILFFKFNLSFANKLSYQSSLQEYLNLPEAASTNFTPISKYFKTDNITGTKSFVYSFISQTWPKSGDLKNQTNWEHTVEIYVPKDIKSDNAILWVNGGTNNPNPDHYYTPQAHKLDFNNIAKTSGSIVVNLNNIPNQFLTIDGKKYAEDALVAYTWAKFLEDPTQHKYFSVYLPMVKAIIKTMDNVLKDQEKFNKHFRINNFIVAGLSKRGMATWLAALHDERIIGIVPFVIDILNTKYNINHIYQSHQSWPIAMHDYIEHKVMQNLSSKNSEYLLQINDPFEYINCRSCDEKTRLSYQERAKTDKYIVLASGDDFFAPDSVLFYYDLLPGNKNLRFIPNSAHMVDSKIINESLATYSYLINTKKQQAIKIIKSEIKRDPIVKNRYILNFVTNTKPINLTLYTARNDKTRDFRLAKGIKYNSLSIDVNKFDAAIFNSNQNYSYQIEITMPTSGWEAHFVEAEYVIHKKVPNLKLTSTVTILPNNYPAIIKSSIRNKIESIIKYGKAVIYPSEKASK